MPCSIIDSVFFHEVRMLLKQLSLIVAVAITVFAVGCNRKTEIPNPETKFYDVLLAQMDPGAVEALKSNPFMQDWTTPYGAPPFSEIKESDFMPAYKFAMDLQMRVIDEIAASQDKPSFANTIVPLAQSGELLGKVENVFSNLQWAETTPTITKIAEDLAPLLSAHAAAIYQNDALFQRVKAVFDKKDRLRLKPEE
jgi:peptidyl-dipeptidase Dcp